MIRDTRYVISGGTRQHFRITHHVSRITCKGFTLIELLVVVLIIGILATFLGLSVGNRSLDNQLENEARRLKAVLQLALEEAESKGVELGFRHTREGYQFLALDDERHWAPYADSGPLRQHTVKAPFELELRVEDRRVPPAQDDPEARKNSEKAKKIEPQFFLLSSGELTPFSLDVAVEGYKSSFRITGGALGDIEIERRDSP